MKKHSHSENTHRRLSMKKIIFTLPIVILLVTSWASADSPDCNPTKTPTPRPTKTSTELPTETPLPTIVPTFTPVPTDTPTPFPTQVLIPDEIIVVNVWTADKNWLPKVHFYSGQPIQWIIDVKSTFEDITEVELTYEVRGPNDESVLYEIYPVPTGNGKWSWGLSGDVLGVYGEHTFTGYATYQGKTTSKTTTYWVGNPFRGWDFCFEPGSHCAFLPIVQMGFMQPPVGQTSQEIQSVFKPIPSREP